MVEYRRQSGTFQNIHDFFSFDAFFILLLVFSMHASGFDLGSCCQKGTLVLRFRRLPMRAGAPGFAGACLYAVPCLCNATGMSPRFSFSYAPAPTNTPPLKVAAKA